MKKSMLATLMLALGLASVGQADWFHYANNVRTPDGNLNHDADMVQMSVVATEIAEGWTCLRYERVSDKAKQGRVKTTARFMDGGEEVGSLTFTSGVTGNRVLNCKQNPVDTPIGVIVEFSHEFLGMPKVLGKKGQYVDVSGLVGETILEPVAAFDLGTLFLTSEDEEARGRIASANSLFLAEGDVSEKHPKSLAQTAVANRDLEEAVVCTSYYRNAANDKSKGRVTASATVTYPDGETEKLNFSSGVSQFQATSCRQLSRDAPIGTVVENDISFKNMPRLKAAAPENFVVATSISTAGNVDFRPPPPPEVPEPPAAGPGPAPPPPPPPPPGGGSGGLSGADIRCISRVLYTGGSGSRQIVRPNKNKGGKFEVFGPRSRIANGAAVPSTLGFGSTYAAACADYERKMGSLGPEGPGLSSGDISRWVWYSNMSSASGPTAVRRDPRGGFHGDYWRPWTGVVILNGSSPGQILDLLRSRGL
jgi:hypothetical protein